ncbi:holin [uncultured Exiguobacterium sp.]|uniref:holin n=1 Tax=uncultured Exiguobacterium sp. TaxID=202669 RepID=UPI00260139F4|nr:holin [uncultured Exiguobacterium sp.]
MTEILLLATLIAPVTLGVNEIIKQAFNVKKNFIPLLGVIVGLAIGFLAAPISDIDIYLRLWAGALSGLSASGLYELTSKRDGTTKS